MCGIAGILTLRDDLASASLEQLARMAGAISHRGPDEFGAFRDACAGLAHARLSVIDLATGQQPLSNEDGTLWVVFNGEIFNYLELRSELQQLGHLFRTNSDTEVIVHAWEAWGEDAWARFNGQWALALWDSRSATLILSRDRFGICPLYYVEHAGRVAFASEVKALFAGLPDLPRAIDPIGMDQTFSFWSVVPPQTIFAGVRELEPGHTRTYARGQPAREHRYVIDTPVGDFAGSLAEATEALRAALEQATRLRMLRADVPVGCYLSGGLDSSVVAALAQRACEGGFSTFSMRFADAEYDETEYQRAMVAKLGTHHHEIVIRRHDINQIFPRVVWHAERPILRAAPAPLLLLSGLVRSCGIKVVLTGEGADEMFAGYDLFREAKIRRFWAKHPESTWRPRLLERLYPYMARSPVAHRALSRQFFGRGLERHAQPGFSHEPRWRGTAALKRLFSAEYREAIGSRDTVAELLSTLPAELSRWPALAQDQYWEQRTLLAGYLLSSQGDRMLTAHSVEGRFPFLDNDVVALANSLPSSYKLRVLDEKHVLKRASHDLIDARILARAKQPYRAPDALSFVGQDRAAWTNEVMTAAALREAGVFDVKAVLQLWQKCTVGRDEAQFSNADNMALIGILSTQLLYRDMVKGAPVSAAVRLKTIVDRTARERAA